MFKKITDTLRDAPDKLSHIDIPNERVAKAGLLKMEEMHLRFTNGVERKYQRMKHGQLGAVMIVPMLDEDTVLLIREYAAGTEQYELVLPKGKVDAGETLEVAANRELKEEVGMGANRLHHINSLTLAPTFMGHITHVFVGFDLFEERLEGDEPEELEVISWQLSNLHELVARPDCTEGRTLAALYMVRDLIQRGELNA